MKAYVRLALFTAFSILATGRVSQTLAANYSWNTLSPSGAWNTAGNWNPSSSVPGAADTAWVVNGGTANVNSALFTLNEACGTLAVGGANSGTVQLGPNLASLTVGGGGELIGNTGIGMFNQTTGTNSSTSFLSMGHFASGSGTYSLSGGSLWTGSTGEYIGDNGNGSFNQTAGTNSTSGQVAVGNNAGSTGSYNLGGSGYVAVPNLYVGLSSRGTFTQTGGVTSVSSSLNVGYNTGSSGTYSLNGGSLAATYVTVGYSASGAFTQDGGANAVANNLILGYNTGGSGSYNLSGGSATAYNMFVGYSASGAFSQTTGTNNVTNALSLGTNASGSGSYTLGSGLLTVSSGLGNEYVGDNGNGTFHQTGGTNSAVGGIVLGNNGGSNGAYSIGGGLLAAPLVAVGNYGNGAFSQTGGGVSLTNQLFLAYDFNANGSYNLSGGSLAAPSVYVGVQGTGSITQIGGTTTIAGDVDLGDPYFGEGSGTYSLNGGSLAMSGSLNVGTSESSGMFIQTGGANTVMSTINLGSEYYVPVTGSGIGTYFLSGSGVLAAGQEVLYFGGGFTQSGGSNLISGTLTLTGTLELIGYDLNGGLLSLGSLAGASALTYSGGTMQLLAGFTASAPIDLNVPGGFATLETSGSTATISSNLFGPGGLNKIGAGSLTLNGSDVYTGSTMVSGGTLAIANDIPTTPSFIAAGGGILQFPGTTLNLGARSIQALAGGTVVYQNATVNGGFLFGPGTHLLPAGSTTTFNTTTINPGAVLQQAGTDTFFDVTDRGAIAVSGSLTIIGGINDGGANMTVNGTADVNSWSNAGVITVNNHGVLNNHVSDLTSYGGARIYVNSGGTLNANSQGEGTALDLQDSLLVNNGRVVGTTNVYYGATVSGSGSFGPINILGGGTMSVVSPAAEQSPGIAAGDSYLPGVITGGGTLAAPISIVSALTCAPGAVQALTLSGSVTGSGSLTASGPGTLVLSNTNTYDGGTIVAGGTLIATNNEALADRSNLTVGNAILFDPVAPASEASAAALSTPATVPEPSTFALLATGVVLLVRLRRCRIS